MTQVSSAVRTSLPPKRYLTGVQGLRTVAALLVAIYHIWLHRVSGGVDVFFVVAGFFAAGSLTRLFSGVGRSTSPKLAASTYLLNTARRVVPSASIVVMSTVALSVAFMPKAFWTSSVKHGLASILYVENWYLIRTSSDYLQQGLTASPFQQFWALSVNVQFYVLYAMVALGAACVARAGSPLDQNEITTRFKRYMFLATLAILLASFVYSVVLTRSDQPAAYFNTGARLWEFMVGSGTFFLLRGDLGFPHLLRVIGWFGLTSLLLLGGIFDLSTSLPGYLALIPVSAAVALIVASWARVEPRILTWKPVLRMADASFAFYLWHWPLLVIYRYRNGLQVSLAAGLAIILLAGLLALMTTKLFEDRIRRSRAISGSRALTLGVTGALTLAALSTLAVWQLAIGDERRNQMESLDAALSGESTDTQFVPGPLIARGDVSGAYSRGCHQNETDPELLQCKWETGSTNRVIAVVGGSHSLQWLEAVLTAGTSEDAEVVSFTKSNCLFGDVGELGFDRHPSCGVWNESLMDELLSMSPDLVVTIGTRDVDGVEKVPTGYVSYFEQLSRAGIAVLAIRDNPWFDFDPVVCAETQPWGNCSVARSDVYANVEDLGFPSIIGVHFLDISDRLCNQDRCGILDEGILMYRDLNHLTTTWVIKNQDVVVESVAEILAQGT